MPLYQHGRFRASRDGRFKITGKDVLIIIRTDILSELPSRMIYTYRDGRFELTTTDGLKKRPHGRFKTSVWGNVRQGILYLVM